MRIDVLPLRKLRPRSPKENQATHFIFTGSTRNMRIG